MNNSRRLLSSTFYEPDDDDNYSSFANPNSSRSSCNLDTSSGSSFLDSSCGSSCPLTLTYNRLKPNTSRCRDRSPRNLSNRSVSPTYSCRYRQEIPTLPCEYRQGTPTCLDRYQQGRNTTMDTVPYEYSYDVDDDEPIKTTLYNQSTIVTQGTRGTRVKRNTTESQEYYIRNSDVHY